MVTLITILKGNTTLNINFDMIHLTILIINILQCPLQLIIKLIILFLIRRQKIMAPMTVLTTKILIECDPIISKILSEIINSCFKLDIVLNELKIA